MRGEANDYLAVDALAELARGARDVIAIRGGAYRDLAALRGADVIFGACVDWQNDNHGPDVHCSQLIRLRKIVGREIDGEALRIGVLHGCTVVADHWLVRVSEAPLARV